MEQTGPPSVSRRNKPLRRLEMSGNGSTSVSGRFCRPGARRAHWFRALRLLLEGNSRVLVARVSEPAGTEGKLRRLRTETRRETSRAGAGACLCEESEGSCPGRRKTRKHLVHRRRAKSLASTAAISVSPPHAAPSLVHRTSRRRVEPGVGRSRDLRQGGNGYINRRDKNRDGGPPVLSWDDEWQRGIGSGSARPTKTVVSQGAHTKASERSSRRPPCSAIHGITSVAA
jgi:hypothetical protein